MRKTIMDMIPAQESINFQSAEFFNEITRHIENVRASNPKNAKDVFGKKLINALESYIFDEKGMMITFAEAPIGMGPAVAFPKLTEFNVLYPGHNVGGEPTGEDLINALKRIRRNSAVGTVDLVTAKVGGIYKEISCTLYMPFNMLTSGSDFTSSETAAIILHEIGHIFTFYEYVSRAVSTNQSIAWLCGYLDNTNESGKRVEVFTKAADILDLDPMHKKALQECKNKEQITTTVMDGDDHRCKSEAGFSLYDTNSGEYLADQFAARCGATLPLVSALDKIFKQYGQTDRGIFMATAFFLIAQAIFNTIRFGKVAAIIGTIFTLYAMAMASRKELQIYDNPRARLERIKLQNNQRLKTYDLPEVLKKQILEENKVIDEKMIPYTDELKLGGIIMYFFSSNFRTAHKFEMLQKDLEKFASSQYFEQAAKLKMV